MDQPRGGLARAPSCNPGGGTGNMRESVGCGRQQRAEGRTASWMRREKTGRDGASAPSGEGPPSEGPSAGELPVAAGRWTGDVCRTSDRGWAERMDGTRLDRRPVHFLTGRQRGREALVTLRVLGLGNQRITWHASAHDSTSRVVSSRARIRKNTRGNIGRTKRVKRIKSPDNQLPK